MEWFSDITRPVSRSKRKNSWLGIILWLRFCKKVQVTEIFSLSNKSLKMLWFCHIYENSLTWRLKIMYHWSWPLEVVFDRNYRWKFQRIRQISEEKFKDESWALFEQLI